ncbi:MAG: DUF938 domain-containing protein [Rhodobacteraceae bacterium]|nr:DUF938 domain-containing protein [Paracoccaceae bacterium]
MSWKPTSSHTAIYRSGMFRPEPDGRMHFAMYERNAKPVIDGLSPFLADIKGNALEIGSGTGQHVIAFAATFPVLHWTPSDPDPVHRTSIDAWRSFENAPTAPALALDAASDWAEMPEVRAISPLSLIISMNVIHISPPSVMRGILNGAAKALAAGGLLVFYGPFKENGKHTGEGNANFDAGLRVQDVDWGLRDTVDIQSIGESLGLVWRDMVVMPSNNRLLVLAKP